MKRALEVVSTVIMLILVLVIVPFRQIFSIDKAFRDDEIYKHGNIYRINKDHKLFLPSGTPEVLAYAHVQRHYYGGWGFVDRSGKIVIEPKFNSSTRFKNGFASVSIGKDFFASQTLIDRTGKPITDKLFAGTSDMFEHLAQVEYTIPSVCYGGDSTNIQTYIDENGRLWKRQFKACCVFREGIAPVRLPTERFHFKQTNPLFCVIENLAQMAENSYADMCYSVNGGYRDYAIVDSKGTTIKRLPGTPELVSFSEGLLPFKAKNLFGFVDTRGNIVIQPKFYAASSFADGLAAVCLSDSERRWGFIDKSGRLVIPFKYSDFQDFHDGLARVGMDEESGFINKKGELVIGSTENFKVEGNFSEGLASVTLPDNGKGFINTSGQIVIKLPPCDVGEFHDGLCYASVLKNGTGLFGYIGKTGKWLIKPQFDRAVNFSEGLAAVYFDDAALLIEKPK
ncbi:MAG: WG repeat-containing protein [Candidatus Obscuribacterales bacterium]|nr:WG repeat-containing protein [Candidatus Obscuribacterales bacterium]